MPIPLPTQPEQAHEVTMNTVDAARQTTQGSPQHDGVNLGARPSLEQIGNVEDGPFITIGEHKIPDGQGGTMNTTSHAAVNDAELPDGSHVTTRSTISWETADPSKVIDSKVNITRQPENLYSKPDTYVFKGDHALARNMVADAAGEIITKNTATPPEDENPSPETDQKNS